MKSIKVCEYSRSRSFHDDIILQDQASGERSQDQWSSGFFMPRLIFFIFLSVSSGSVTRVNQGSHVRSQASPVCWMKL